MYLFRGATEDDRKATPTTDNRLPATDNRSSS